MNFRHPQCQESVTTGDKFGDNGLRSKGVAATCHSLEELLASG
jgi:hypothetical protein